MTKGEECQKTQKMMTYFMNGPLYELSIDNVSFVFRNEPNFKYKRLYLIRVK